MKNRKLIAKCNDGGPGKRAPSRPIFLDTLEQRTLFSATAVIAAELSSATSGGASTDVGHAAEVHRMAPPADNWQVNHQVVASGNVDQSENESGSDPVTGDLNGDSRVDATDINMLTKALHPDTPNRDFDLNGDGITDMADHNYLVRELIGTEYGDANLDGKIDEDDAEIFLPNLFSAQRGWQNGDFNGDYRIDGSDFLLWNRNKFTTTQLGKELMLGDDQQPENPPAETPPSVDLVPSVPQLEPTTGTTFTPSEFGDTVVAAVVDQVAANPSESALASSEPIEADTDEAESDSNPGRKASILAAARLHGLRKDQAIEYASPSKVRAKDSQGSKLINYLEEFVL